MCPIVANIAAFPCGLSGFFLYACVTMIDFPEHICFPSSITFSSSTYVFISSVQAFPAAFFPFRLTHVKLLSAYVTPNGLSHVSLSFDIPSYVTLLPVSTPFSSNPRPTTVSFVCSTICFRHPTSFTKTATSLHTLHVNTTLLSPPMCSYIPYWIQLPQLLHTGAC